MPRNWNFARMFDGERWLYDVRISTDDCGTIIDIEDGVVGDIDESCQDWLIPGMVNAHSHAFQFAMAGMAEAHHPKNGHDDFWSWRQRMYQVALRISTQDMRAIGAMVYADMLENGYTHVVEFHYLHHQPDGSPYPQMGEMAMQLAKAARDVGIGLTLVPQLYQTGDIGESPRDDQRRFLFRGVDAYLQYLRDLRRSLDDAGLEQVIVGSGVHSIRAVPLEGIEVLLGMASGLKGPKHMHIAEQTKEVAASVEAYGFRPVSLLASKGWLRDDLSLVHATHIDRKELKAICRASSTVVLCPTTEANLGDGIFPFAEFLRAGGCFGIGSDSQVSRSPIEELRWLDYQVRLSSRRRLGWLEEGGEMGEILFRRALQGGLKAAGLYHQNSSLLTIGRRLNGMLLDARHPVLCAANDGTLLSKLIYAGDRSCISGVITDGVWRVKNGSSIQKNSLRAAYADTLKRLTHQ